MRPWTLELVRFVCQERQTVISGKSLVPWSELRGLWNRRYPQKTYDTWQAMRRSYLEATRPREDSWPAPGSHRRRSSPGSSRACAPVSRPASPSSRWRATWRCRLPTCATCLSGQIEESGES